MKHILISNIRTHLKLALVATALAMVFASCQKEEVEQSRSTTPEITSNLKDSSGAIRITGMPKEKVGDSAISAAVSYNGYPGNIQYFRVEGYASGYTSPFLWFVKRYAWRSSAYSNQTQIIRTYYTIYKRLAGSSQWYYYDQVSPAAISVPAGYGGAYFGEARSVITPDYRGGSYYWVNQTTVWSTVSGVKIGSLTINYNGAGGATDYANPRNYPNVTAYTNQIFFIGY